MCSGTKLFHPFRQLEPDLDFPPCLTQGKYGKTFPLSFSFFPVGLSLVKFRTPELVSQALLLSYLFFWGVNFSDSETDDIGPSSLSDRIMYLDLCHDFLVGRRNLNLAMTSRLALTNGMITARGLECTFVIYSGTQDLLRLIWTKQLLPRCLGVQNENTG